MRSINDIKSIIANKRSELPITIKVAKLKSFEKRGVKKSFLANLVVNETNEYGVFRNNYFLIATGKVFRTPTDSQSLRVFAPLMDKFYLRGFDYVMIII
jgi:hypothetical protein